MSTDSTVIRPRTLYEVRQSIKPNRLIGGLRDPALNEVKRLAKEMVVILEPLSQNNDVFSPALLRDYGLLSDPQYNSLVKGAKEWIRSETQSKNEMYLWLGDDLVEAERRITPEYYDIEIEEPDLDFEQCVLNVSHISGLLDSFERQAQRN